MASITIRFPGTPAILQASRGLFSVEAPAAYGSKGSGTAGLTILPASLLNATVGTSYSQLLTASGGTAPYYFDIESAAPNSGRWLALPVATLTGTPQAAETSSVTIRATDSNGVTATKTYSLTSVATGSLAIMTASLPVAINGSFYAYQLLAKGGVPPYAWSWPSAQPWQVTPDGWLEGTPTANSTLTFSAITVKDSAGASASFSPSLTISSGSAMGGYDSTLGTLNIPPAIAGHPYSHQLVGYGAGGWSISSGSLPPGLSLTAGGVITGTPLAAGNHAVSVQFGLGAVKWNPGHYAASNQTVKKSNNGWTNRKAEIDQALVNANVLGYYDIHFWNTIEDASAGTYSWTNIDQARDYIQSTYPGKRYGVMIWVENFGSTTASSVIPAYILASSSYGSSPNSDYGYWNLGTYGICAAWWRPAVAARVQALFAALAAHQSAGQSSVGIANYDTDPYFQMATWNESAADLSSGSDVTQTNATTQWIATNSSLVASFPHTQIVSQNNFLTGTQANTETTVHTESGNRLAAGGPDIFGASGAPANLTWGQRGYVGLDGYTNLKGFMPYVGFVQQPDYSYTVADIGAAALGTGTNGLNASEIWWTVFSGGNGDWTTNVLPFINANPVTNTAYPASYP